MMSHRISKLCNCEPAAVKKQMMSHRINKLWNCEPAAAKKQMRSHRISKLCNCEPAAAKEQMTSHKGGLPKFERRFAKKKVVYQSLKGVLPQRWVTKV